MKNEILTKDQIDQFPFNWIDIEFLPYSNAQKIEIYLNNVDDKEVGLFQMFDFLFESYKHSIRVYNKSWWDFCLDTWDIDRDTYNYELTGKSPNSRSYLQLLINSNIEIGYSGVCSCSKWSEFIPVILKCILSNEAPYSHFFFDKEGRFIFYFHHTGSIGLLFNSTSPEVEEILRRSRGSYLVS